MKRVERLLQDPLFQDYIARNVELEHGEKFCNHDLQHAIDVARITYILVLEHQDLGYYINEAGLSGRLAAKETIYAAGLLHDIGKWQEYRTGVDHAAYGSRLARQLLPLAYFNENEVNVISQAIYEHRNIYKDMSFLGERLHRADNLSRACLQCEFRHDCVKFKNKDMVAYLLVY
ncbi:MAG: HD domain-containing protein [Syntrophomonadaceae bacterium]|nr:HD domain-containing protein [Syntrophomonadaceae bacterium]